MNRRQVVEATAVGLLTGLAGCSAGGGDDPGTGTATPRDQGPPTPPADASPRSLLPEPPEGMELHDTREVGAGIDAEAGIQGTFTPDGSIGYQVYVYRFASASAASEAADGIAEQAATATANDQAYVFRVAVRTGNFVVAGGHGGGTDEQLVELLGRVEGVTESSVEANDLV